MNLKRRSKAVKEYKLQWLYKVGNRRIEGSTDTVQAGANGASNSTDAIYNIIYSPPSDAVEVAVKVTVVGKTYKYYKNKTAKPMPLIKVGHRYQIGSVSTLIKLQFHQHHQQQ